MAYTRYRKQDLFVSSDLTLTANRTHALAGFNLAFTGTGNTGFGEGTPTARVHVKGINALSGSFALKVDNTSQNLFTIENDGYGVFTGINFSVTGNNTATSSLKAYGVTGQSTAILADGGNATFGVSANGGGTACIKGDATSQIGIYGLATTGIGINAYTTVGNAFLANSQYVNLSGNINKYTAKILRGNYTFNGFDNTGAVLEVDDDTSSGGALVNVIKEGVLALKVNADRSMQLGTFTATQASALTGVDAKFIYVTSTNGTFTSVGFWGYVAGTWEKLNN